MRLKLHDAAGAPKGCQSLLLKQVRNRHLVSGEGWL